jgi:hypothetical protein
MLPATGLLFVAWINLHFGALFGVLVIAVVGVLAAARSTTRGRAPWCFAACAIAVLGSLINPYGLAVISQGMRVQSSSSPLIVEWHHLDPTSPAQVTTLVLGLAALAVAIRRRDVVLVGSLAVCAAGAVEAIRMLPFLLITAIPILASGASGDRVQAYLRSRRGPVLFATIAWLASSAYIAVPALKHIGRPSPAYYSPAAVRAIPAGCRVFNQYMVGGYIILERPDVTVSLDSRSDMYGAARLADDERTVAGTGDLSGELASADCVLVSPHDGLAHRLEVSEAWRVAEQDPVSELFVRR